MGLFSSRCANPNCDENVTNSRYVVGGRKYCSCCYYEAKEIYELEEMSRKYPGTCLGCQYASISYYGTSSSNLVPHFEECGLKRNSNNVRCNKFKIKGFSSFGSY